MKLALLIIYFVAYLAIIDSNDNIADKTELKNKDETNVSSPKKFI